MACGVSRTPILSQCLCGFNVVLRKVREILATCLRTLLLCDLRFLVDSSYYHVTMQPVGCVDFSRIIYDIGLNLIWNRSIVWLCTCTGIVFGFLVDYYRVTIQPVGCVDFFKNCDINLIWNRSIVGLCTHRHWFWLCFLLFYRHESVAF